MFTTIASLRRYVALALVVTGLIFTIGVCSSGSQSAGASQPAVAAAQTKVNTKISPADYQAKFGAGADHLLVDVRTPEEFNSGHIAGAVNIPVDQLAQRLNEVPKDKPVVVYCRSGNRSGQAAQFLDSSGYPQIYDLGGIVTWTQQGFPVQ